VIAAWSHVGRGSTSGSRVGGSAKDGTSQKSDESQDEVGEGQPIDPAGCNHHAGDGSLCGRTVDSEGILVSSRGLRMKVMTHALITSKYHDEIINRRPVPRLVSRPEGLINRVRGEERSPQPYLNNIQ
jgi:hypothetical protein